MSVSNKLLDTVFRIEYLIIAAVALVYGMILFYIPNGISCDEGYYLMGYLNQQELGPMVNDFHNIVRFITHDSLQDNVMFFRYLRFVLDFVSALLFGLISYRWLRGKHGFVFNKAAYVGLIMLGASIAYTYTTATISFDHLQHIIYFFAISFFLASDLATQRLSKIILQLFTGCFLTLAITNYLPSGLLLLLVFVFFTVINSPCKSAISKTILLIFSLLVGFLLYHLSINPLDNYFDNVSTSMKVASDGVTRHDSASLILKMLTAIGVFVLIQIPFVIGGFLSKKVKADVKITIVVSILIVATLFIFRKIYLLQGYLYYIPVSFVLGFYFAEKGFYITKKQISNVLLFVMISFLPFMGIFGTNQSIISKIMIFMPFWVVLFAAILSQLKIEKIKFNSLLLVVIALYSFGYLYQGNFRRYHSYYTPRSSKYELTMGDRYQNVKVSAYEHNYYQTFADTLKSIDFKQGSTALAFGEQQIGLYLMGGYFHGPLVYSVNQYVKIPAQKSPFIFLFKKEEKSTMEQLKNSGWNFPAGYERIEIGSMAENLDAENHNTVIYYLK